jgi:hypothetical protein
VELSDEKISTENDVWFGDRRPLVIPSAILVLRIEVAFWTEELLAKFVAAGRSGPRNGHAWKAWMR